MAPASSSAPPPPSTSPTTQVQPPSPIDSDPSSDPPSSSHPSGQRLSRPVLGSRKSSGTIIIPRDSAAVEPKDEEYDAGDARAMSPRRNSEEIDKMGDDARHALEQQAEALQSNLLEIIERVDSVKSEHERLEGGNKFLQSYIGELMQTSKITSAGSGNKSKRGRGTK